MGRTYLNLNILGFGGGGVPIRFENCNHCNVFFVFVLFIYCYLFHTLIFTLHCLQREFLLSKTKPDERCALCCKSSGNRKEDPLQQVKVLSQYSETQEKRSLETIFFAQLELPVEQLTTMGDKGVCVADVHIAAEEQPKAGQEQHYNPK